MKHEIIHGNTLTTQTWDNIYHFCKKLPAHPNYSVDQWEKNTSCLLYKLKMTQLFNQPSGGLVLVYDNNNIIHCSGWYRSEFHPDIYIGGVRTITHPDYRHALYASKYSIPAQRDMIIRSGGKMIAYTFDSANKTSVYTQFVRGKFNLFLKNRETEFMDVYKNLTALPFPVNIMNTKQWILYQLLDPSFYWDWNNIREE